MPAGGEAGRHGHTGPAVTTDAQGDGGPGRTGVGPILFGVTFLSCELIHAPNEIQVTFRPVTAPATPCDMHHAQPRDSRRAV